MPKENSRSLGLISIKSISYDLNDEDDIAAWSAAMERDAIREDLGETHQSHWAKRLEEVRRHAINALAQEGFPAKEGLYLEKQDGYEGPYEGGDVLDLRRRALEEQYGSSKGVRWPFFNFERPSRASLAAEMIFEADELRKLAERTQDGWRFVERALYFSTTQSRFLFEFLGHNTMANREWNREPKRRKNVSLAQQKKGKKTAAVACDKAGEIFKKHPTWSLSRIAADVAKLIDRSERHTSRILSENKETWTRID
jgi:hypothetical protein